MQTIIFKNEKKAKCYNVFASNDQGIYKKGELIRKVKTDDIDRLNQGTKDQITVEEIKQD